MTEKTLTRRNALKAMAATGVALTASCRLTESEPPRTQQQETTMKSNPVVAEVPLPDGVTPMPTRDPFLFCVHHNDDYPKGNAQFGPNQTLAGRNLGNDFVAKDGFRMYHGEVVPGFPRHPHRGFETVTIVRRGLLDHSDSMGAAARYGKGDVQWLTAGGGIQHAEMFPLLSADERNPVELFQIWLNLPASRKMVTPYFSMLWADQIPKLELKDANGRRLRLSIFAGHYQEHKPPPPPPDSWAADQHAEVAIWTLRMEPHAQFVMPKTSPLVDRSLYVLDGHGLELDGHPQSPRLRLDLERGREVVLKNGDRETELLLLQGCPINEPVAHYGPFVMNTEAELRKAIYDYRATQFGGWPWPQNDPVHGGESQRFARHLDGRVERPG